MISLADILSAAAAQAGFTARDLVGRTPHPDIWAARDRAVLLARRLRPDFSAPFLGRHLGGRDHSSILASERRAEERLALAGGAEPAAVGEVLARLGVDELPPVDETARLRILLERELRAAEALADDIRAKLSALTSGAVT